MLFWGTPDFAVPSLEALLRSPHTVVGLVTQPDRPRGRSGRAEPPPTKLRLLSSRPDVPVLQPERPRGAEFRATLAGLRPDVSVVAAYGNLLPERVLELPRHGSLNVHASLLPRHRGAAPVSAAILAGDEVTGITLMRMERGLDTGPILLQRELPVRPEESSGELTRRLAELGGEVLMEGLQALTRGRLEARRQDERLATYAPRVTPADARVRWSRPAAEVERALRAFDPWPGATSSWNGRRVKIFRGRALEEPPGRAQPPAERPRPGEVLASPPGSLRVACGAGMLEVLELQMEGRPRMAVADFLRGRLMPPGTCFT
ncbi:MAG: methionyl-tRNA formyltransferase [Gemmatimonadota bacterium]